MQYYSIYLKKSQITIKHNNQCSLLETLEKNNIFPEYQCRSGFCGACRVLLVKGTVSYPNPPLAFCNTNEVLLCCCKVESDLEIDL
ncbi:(2Fe-2S)-binding protein [Mergibacter septicus]|uniref:class I ribonucleotide reductase maintenance protein YfaE n=1 Tax=Mergibacter septicus TaxID=221402 RepID=UPI001C77FC40|nr:class I ribonucleotide reductase maintenance protein YfaE [Mergibacter septicus]QDJ13866.1 (2Fe-2S)-binding protein [Mergibacter septicus]